MPQASPPNRVPPPWQTQHTPEPLQAEQVAARITGPSSTVNAGAGAMASARTMNKNQSRNSFTMVNLQAHRDAGA